MIKHLALDRLRLHKCKVKYCSSICIEVESNEDNICLAMMPLTQPRPKLVEFWIVMASTWYKSSNEALAGDELPWIFGSKFLFYIKPDTQQVEIKQINDNVDYIWDISVCVETEQIVCSLINGVNDSHVKVTSPLTTADFDSDLGWFCLAFLKDMDASRISLTMHIARKRTVWWLFLYWMSI